MYKSDVEMFYRMAMSRMELAREEILRIQSEIRDSKATSDAINALDEAIEFFADARDEAANQFGFEIGKSMKT